MKKQTQAAKRYQDMNLQELREATAEFDAPFVADRSRPMNPRERAKWRRFQGKLRGRPLQGRGAKPINVTIERGLLERADAYARRMGITRAQLIAQGIQSVLRRRAG